MRSNEFDVLVIGEGLSGICAAATACQNGARVVLASKGPGTFMLRSGCINLDELEASDGAGLPFKASDIGPAISAFVELTLAAGSSYEGGIGERRLVPTSLGTFRRGFPCSSAAMEGRSSRFCEGSCLRLRERFPVRCQLRSRAVVAIQREQGTLNFIPAR